MMPPTGDDSGMVPAERQIHDRLGSALYRLADITQRASTGVWSPRLAGKLIIEVRKLTSEVEKVFVDVQRLGARYIELQDEASIASRRGQLLFDHSPLPCVIVEMNGSIAGANPAAVRLLNVSHRHMLGRPFPLFLSADREVFLRRLASLRMDDEPQHWPASLRPRERSAVETTLIGCLDGTGRVMIMIHPADGSRLAAANHSPELSLVRDLGAMLEHEGVPEES